MLTLILPVRNWPVERTHLCIKSFKALGSEYLNEIVVVDFGSVEPIRLDIDDPQVRLVRLEAEVWSAGEALNAGVAAATNSVIAKADSDMLVGPDSRREFDRLVRLVERNEIGMAIAQATDLPQGIEPQAAFDMIINDRQALGRLRPKWGEGGLVIFTRATWDAIGGAESRFTGWGNEDNDFAERIRRSGRKTLWADRQQLPIYHVWHPPTYAATGVLSLRQKNQRLANTDKSILRSLRFRHSNAEEVFAPAVVQTISPLVTLAIATTARPNRERMITEAIDSFRGQIDNDFEVVVVDNGSPWDESARLRHVLGQIKWTDRIRLEVEKWGSIPHARNVITQMARGRYICVVDDDDIALPNRLADHLKPFASDGCIHGSHGGWIDFDESTGVIERNQGKQRGIATLLKGTGKVTAHPASFYRADVMRAVPYDESFQLGSDLDLALRLANNGFEVAHTSSFVVLRRYHSANVTITGQSNQVSNGAFSRSRVHASFDWQRLHGLEEEAKANNAEVYCRNQLSIDSIAELIPGYTGVWQIYVPVAALSGSGPQAPVLSAPTIEANGNGTALQMLGMGAGAGYGEDRAASSGSTLQRLLEIVSGDICTRNSGLNQPIFFRSEGLVGLEKARQVKAAVEDLVGVRVQLNSVRQGEIDRSVPFEWKQLTINAGERVLQSQRFDDLSELLGVLATIGHDSLLTAAVSVLSDYDEQGEAYYFVTRSIKGFDNLRQLEFDLERRLKMPFRYVAANGVESELTPGNRSH